MLKGNGGGEGYSDSGGGQGGVYTCNNLGSRFSFPFFSQTHIYIPQTYIYTPQTYTYTPQTYIYTQQAYIYTQLTYKFTPTNIHHNHTYAQDIQKENRIFIRGEFRQSLGINLFSPFQPEREFKVYKSCKCSQIIWSRVH